MEMVLAFTGCAAWMYTLIEAAANLGAGIPLPEWWYPACAIALLTAFIAIVVSVDSYRSTKRMPKDDPRRLGVIRYDADKGEWYCDDGRKDR